MSINQSGWPDLNRRPLDPQSSALSKLRYSPRPLSYLPEGLSDRPPVWYAGFRGPGGPQGKPWYTGCRTTVGEEATAVRSHIRRLRAGSSRQREGSPLTVVASSVRGAVSKSSVCLITYSALKQTEDFLTRAGTERVDREAALQLRG